MVIFKRLLVKILISTMLVCVGVKLVLYILVKLFKVYEINFLNGFTILLDCFLIIMQFFMFSIGGCDEN